MTIFFTSDSHFGHTRILEYSSRPFSSIEEHDETLIKNWNRTVGQRTVVYHLGDFCLGTPTHAKNVLRRLNGQIHLVYGNHDSRLMKDKEFLHMFSWHGHYKEISHENQKIILFHFPIESWNKRHYDSWHLFGHSHGSLPVADWDKKLDVGVDVWNYAPVSFEEVKEKMDKKQTKPVDHHGRGHNKKAKK